MLVKLAELSAWQPRREWPVLALLGATDLTIRLSAIGQEARMSQVSGCGGDLAVSCPARDAAPNGVVGGPDGGHSVLANYGRPNIGPPPEDPQASGQPPGPHRGSRESMLYQCHLRADLTDRGSPEEDG